MPKIIKDARGKIIMAARTQAMSLGVSHLNMRNVAKDCGIAVGTLYNYFDNKESLAVAFMLDDWYKILGEMKAFCEETDSPTEAMRCIYDGINKFRSIYSSLFADSWAIEGYVSHKHEHKNMLYTQLAGLIEPSLKKTLADVPADLPMFMGMSLLTLVMDDWSFERIEPLLTSALQYGSRLQ